MASRAVALIPKVEGMPGREAPRLSVAPGPGSPRPLGYVCIPARMEVYSHGFLQKPAVRPKSFCPFSGLPIYGENPRSRGSVGAKRGQITGMSYAAARRMREDILTRTVVDAKLFDVSITAPGKGYEWSQSEWVRREKMFVMRLVRGGLCGWLRREMQARDQVHAHLMIYAKNSIPVEQRNALIYLGWWNCLTEEEQKAPGAWEHHCVVKGPFDDASECPEWFEYMCGHTTKRKAAQARYNGKQWGRFGSKILEGREKILSVELEPVQTRNFTRCLGRYILSRQKAKRNDLLRKGKKCRKRLRRPSMRIDARRIRFMPGSLVRRMLQWVKM